MADKMKLIAQRFMTQIQDTYAVDGSGNVLPGNLVRSVDKLNNYLGQAMNNYFRIIWSASKGKEDFLKKLPELFDTVSVTFLQGTSTINVSVGTFIRKNVFDVLDSKSTSLLIEAWELIHLNDALTGNDPFYAGSATAPGMIFNNPTLYLFPTNLTASAPFTFNLNFIKLPVVPTTGNYFDVNGSDDCPFSIDHLKDVADLAAKIYDEDDAKEDPQ